MLEIEYKLNEIDSVAKKTFKHATSKIFLFKSEMGTGKTTLIKALVKLLGIDDSVSSPTFSLVNEYQSSTNTVYHFDLYRVETESELYDFGIEDYLNNEAYLFIEWPELVEPLLENFNIITIEFKDHDSRVLKMFSN